MIVGKVFQISVLATSIGFHCLLSSEFLHRSKMSVVSRPSTEMQEWQMVSQ